MLARVMGSNMDIFQFVRGKIGVIIIGGEVIEIADLEK